MRKGEASLDGEVGAGAYSIVNGSGISRGLPRNSSLIYFQKCRCILTALVANYLEVSSRLALMIRYSPILAPLMAGFLVLAHSSSARGCGEAYMAMLNGAAHDRTKHAHPEKPRSEQTAPQQQAPKGPKPCQGPRCSENRSPLAPLPAPVLAGPFEDRWSQPTALLPSSEPDGRLLIPAPEHTDPLRSIHSVFHPPR
jgi:hypothetical protein